MTAETDLTVSFPVLAAALGISRQAAYISRLRGDLPRPDHRRGCANLWNLSTLRAWNPTVADRCLATLRALEAIPLDAA